ncbi:MAG: hypothetical protein ACOX3U_00875 [Christensenellales bacterium]
MRYIKSSRAVKPQRKQIFIPSFEGVSLEVSEHLLPYKYSPMSYNYRFSDGALSGCEGIDNAKFPLFSDSSVIHECPVAPNSIVGLWLYRRYDNQSEMRDDRIIIRCADNKFYETKFFFSDSFHELAGIETAGRVNTASYRLNGNDVLLISSEYGKLWVYDGENPPYSVDNSPEISSMCIHYERLFATTGGEKNQVWFSDDFDPTNWNISMKEGGFIEFSDDAGRANKVISFLDHIYIFRDYGINRLTAYGSQNEFTMSRLFISSGRIYPDTVAAGGDRVFFLADDGVYAFDGVSARKILANIQPMLKSKDYATGCIHDGKYYLALRLKFDDEKVLSEKEPFNRNNALVEYDFVTGSVNIIRGVDINCMLPINLINTSMLTMAFRSLKRKEIGMTVDSGAFFNTPMPKFWRTPMITFNRKDGKFIREIAVDTEEDIIVGVWHNRYSEFKINGSDKISVIKPAILADKFYVYLKSPGNRARIKSLAVIADLISR